MLLFGNVLSVGVVVDFGRLIGFVGIVFSSSI